MTEQEKKRAREVADKLLERFKNGISEETMRREIEEIERKQGIKK